jgi:oxygen-independent coproporphyrinogen III oxidase
MGVSELGLYIHIPFCKAKCHYCDFNSFAGRDNYIPAYFDAIKREIELYSEKLKEYSFKTIFIGGGTPSLVDTNYIYQIINTCFTDLNINKSAEISIETNPGTLSYSKLEAFNKMGINRLSIGLQAWQNNLLAKLGRIHNNKEFSDNFKQAKNVGFKNINVDLIFGIPGQTLKDWQNTLNKVIELEPLHISCYSLKIEEGTIFGERLMNGELTELDDETDREMYHSAVEILGANNYNHYEISNFAKCGFECKHNLVYWNAEEYVGIGAGAHSYLDGKRFNNEYDIEKYISLVSEGGIYIENEQLIDENEMIVEFIILGLRLVEGISINEFKVRFNKDLFDTFGGQIQKLLKKQLIVLDGDRVKLTTLGLDLANRVFMEFI